MSLNVDHICFAVSDILVGIKNWTTAFGYRQMTEVIVNTRQQVKVVFLEKEESVLVKLIEPLEQNESVTSFVKKGGGFHHICFKGENLESSIQDLKEKGLYLMVPPQPGEAFENENIAFMLSRFGVNVEIIDTDKKAGRI